VSGLTDGRKHPEMREGTLLQVRDLVKDFDITKGLTRRRLGSLRAVNHVSFHIDRGETLGLVGESGCGKTTTGRCLIRAVEPTAGEVLYRGSEGEPVDVTGLEAGDLRRVRREMRLIFQDPFASLNPRMTVFNIVAAPLKANRLVSDRAELLERVARILSEVGLNPEHMRRYPHAFSGGQRQRIAIARALVSQPRLVIADEPVSALDVSVQAQVLNLLEELKAEHALTFLFIAHNLAVVEHMCDRIAVMYMGGIVELTHTEALYSQPRHPYTAALLSAIPDVDPDRRRRHVPLAGEVGDLMDPPSGCLFHPRCRHATDACAHQVPGLINLADEGQPEHLVACHHARELELTGI
jgi:peptide/nickel transport system ATP-binding protein